MVLLGAMNTRVLAAAAVLTGLCAAILREINAVQPLPYMDEIFHIPQAQSYCNHNYSHWDPMITTLPGLYISSVLWVEPVARLLSVQPSVLCTPAILRAQNVVCSVLLFLVLHWLLRNLHKGVPSNTHLLSALSLVSFPPLFFFTFLYYTDMGATLCVLSAYALSLSHRHLMAGLLLLAAIFFRQTSVVWVVFIAGVAAIRALETNFDSNRKHSEESLGFHLLSSLFSKLLSLPLSSPPSLLLSLLSSLLPLLWPYAALCLAFVSFVLWNGSIVVGDKTHHQACFHLPQIFYFTTCAALFSSPYLLADVRLWAGFLRTLRRARWIIALVALVLFGLIAVHYYTYTHPYLLADNRHYPFYVWKNIYRQHEAVKCLLVPIYSLAALFFIYALLNSQTDLWVILFLICCVVSLIPQKLLEFRYFIIPHLLLRLHLPSPPSLSPLLELLLHTAVNVATLWVFLYRPFHWPDSDAPQRFMW